MAAPPQKVCAQMHETLSAAWTADVPYRRDFRKIKKRDAARLHRMTSYTISSPNVEKKTRKKTTHSAESSVKYWRFLSAKSLARTNTDRERERERERTLNTL